MHAKSLQSCLTLRLMDCSLLGSYVLGTPQARILKWFVVPSSREPSEPRVEPLVSYVCCIGQVNSLTLAPTEKKFYIYIQIICKYKMYKV